MRFQRYIKARPVDEAPSPRRMAAAKRAIQRQLDKVPLFPEMVKHHTPEARIKNIDEGSAHMVNYWREHRAANWREARRTLREMDAADPATARGLRDYWQKAFCPGDPVFLLALIRQTINGEFSPARRAMELQRVRLLGQVTREVSVEVALPAWPNMLNRDVTFIGLHIARQIANARAPHLFPPLDCDEEADVFQLLTQPHHAQTH